MRSLGWVLIQSDCALVRKGNENTHTTWRTGRNTGNVGAQRKGPVGTEGEGGHPKGKKRAFRRNPGYQPFAFGHLDSRTEINFCY